jgi:hypothetical protein
MIKMDYAQMSDDLFVYEYTLRQAEREYNSYIKQGAWSDEICYRVDILNEIIQECIDGMSAIEEILKTDE